MFTLVDKIFPWYYSVRDKRDDTSKDANDKGTRERFVETIGADVDDNITPLIDDMQANLRDPRTALPKYIPYLESMAGFELGRWLYLSTSMDVRRMVLRNITKYYNIKGTKKSYELMLAMIGLEVEVVEYFGEYGFDSTTTFDDPIRRFDSGCPACSDYALHLDGEPAVFPTSLMPYVRSIIEFNEPINARLREVTYKDEPIPELAPDFNSDYNSDFLI